MFVSRAGWFSVRYPSDWEIEEDDYVAVYDPAGVGALHISGYQGPEEVDPKVELIEHLSEKSPSVDHVEMSRNGEYLIASHESINDESFEKVWFLSRGPYLVIATYSVDADNVSKEMAEVEDIIRSIRIDTEGCVTR